MSKTSFVTQDYYREEVICVVSLVVQSSGKVLLSLAVEMGPNRQIVVNVIDCTCEFFGVHRG